MDVQFQCAKESPGVLLKIHFTGIYCKDSDLLGLGWGLAIYILINIKNDSFWKNMQWGRVKIIIVTMTTNIIQYVGQYHTVHQLSHQLTICQTLCR